MSQSSESPQSEPAYAPVREVRLAVVMYGGGSLAIYINGVAQELLRLVRATAPAVTPNGGVGRALIATKDLRSSEAVYRKLSLLEPTECGLSSPTTTEKPAIRTRFVVDILSGTSAGGINAIFLAKALANMQSMDNLKKLWLEEGDFGKLLNDKWSITRDIPGLKLQTPPKSLLNSERMYRKLLQAFDNMDSNNSPSIKGKESPLVDELDLYVTATDMTGLDVQLRLSDKVVWERRHRHVFHFLYAAEKASGEFHTDFYGGVRHEDARDAGTEQTARPVDMNPFLAFAARCTSAFPLAFEPMRLEDVEGFVRRRHGVFDAKKWPRFFPGYPGAAQDGATGEHETRSPGPSRSSDAADLRGSQPYWMRSFGDGGYLDNKPFSHAIERLFRKRAALPVDRKLLYIEPSPELSYAPEAPSDAIENLSVGVLKLPRYETIREDIERVIEQNALVRRLNEVLEQHIMIEHVASANKDKEPLSGGAWGKELLNDQIKLRGLAYATYHRLKVASVTDELAAMITRIARFEENSDQRTAIGNLVKAWRDLSYSDNGPETPTASNASPPRGSASRPKQLTARFLVDFDLSYRLRRIDFICRLVGELGSVRYCDDSLRKLLDAARIKYWPDREACKGACQEGDSTDPTWLRIDKLEKEKAAELEEFRDALRRATQVLSEAFVDLRKVGRNLRRRDENPLSELVQGLGITGKHLWSILETPCSEAREELAERIVLEEKKGFDRSAAFAQLSDRLREVLSTAFQGASEKIKHALERKSPGSTPADAARECILHFYDNYDDFDMLSFPVLYGRQIGEANEIEVFRISPADSCALIDEGAGDRKKLAGTTLMNFGAFLNRFWRENDMLWGRLDAAERIIQAVAPAVANKDELIKQAHTAILEEEISLEQRDKVANALITVLGKLESQDRTVEGLRSHFKTQLKVDIDARLAEVLSGCLKGPDELRGYYAQSYKVDRTPDREESVRIASRATEIMGELLQNVSNERKMDSKYAWWIANTGRLGWRLVEVASPRKIWSLVSRYWLSLLYAFDILMIVGGTIAGRNEITQFGWLALAATIVANIVLAWVEGWLSKWSVSRYLLGLTKGLFDLGLRAAIVVLVIIGLVHLRSDFLSTLKRGLGFVRASTQSTPDENNDGATRAP